MEQSNTKDFCSALDSQKKLTIDEFRALTKNKNISDIEAEAIIESIYQLSWIAIESITE